MEQSETSSREEVKDPGSTAATLKWPTKVVDGHGSSCLTSRFGSNEVTALHGLGPHPRKGDRSEACSAFSSERRISSYAPSYQKE
jgi:hypothetical protein